MISPATPGSREIGAVGNVLGRVDVMTPPAPPDLLTRFMMAVDRGRNALAHRVYTTIGGEPGAIAAAMVTGKRDLLSDDTKEIIREAGIFHIITISGVQMTLVAGIFFVGLRRLLALSPMLALRYPIKKWAAAAAIVGAVFYDIMTGSRVGTERALIMTTIMLAAVLVERQSLSMRNLAIAAGLVIAIEPEALLGCELPAILCRGRRACRGVRGARRLRARSAASRFSAARPRPSPRPGKSGGR